MINADTKVNENDIVSIFKVKLSNQLRGIEIFPGPGLPKLPGGGNRDFLSNEILAGIELRNEILAGIIFFFSSQLE